MTYTEPHFSRRGKRPILDRFTLVEGGGIQIDIPGPYIIEWSKRVKAERIRKAVPVLAGVAAAAAPYAVGAAIVAYAPPPYKPIGVSMMIPTGAGEAFWFAVGYTAADRLQDQVPDWAYYLS
tara:strand:+ start:131 stop:496 length:366 start_codon:yes stop_codon:yes gene_type:complete